MNKIFIEKFNNKKLFFDFIILKHDGIPIVFSCVDDDEQLYLCVTISDWVDYECLIVKTNVYALEKLVEKSIDILSVYSFSDCAYKYSIDRNNNEFLKEISFNEIKDEKYIEPNIFLECDNKHSAIDYLKTKININKFNFKKNKSIDYIRNCLIKYYLLFIVRNDMAFIPKQELSINLSTNINNFCKLVNAENLKNWGKCQPFNNNYYGCLNEIEVP